jgi:hypothetical protein
MFKNLPVSFDFSHIPQAKRVVVPLLYLIEEIKEKKPFITPSQNHFLSFWDKRKTIVSVNQFRNC